MSDVLLDYNGLVRYDGKIKNYIDSKYSTLSVEIPVAAWSNNTATIQVVGVTATNTIIAIPAPASIDMYTDSEIRCTAQSVDSLTFTCEEVPSATITMNILIIG